MLALAWAHQDCCLGYLLDFLGKVVCLYLAQDEAGLSRLVRSFGLLRV